MSVANLFALFSLGGIAFSPFIVPVAGCVMILGIVVSGIWSNVRTEEMRSRERMECIARGITPPPTPEELAITHGKPAGNLLRRRANIRLTGIVLLGSAAGIILFFIALAAVLQQRDVLCGAAVGLIPLGVGIAFLIDSRIQSGEIEEAAVTQPAANHTLPGIQP